MNPRKRWLVYFIGSVLIGWGLLLFGRQPPEAIHKYLLSFSDIPRQVITFLVCVGLALLLYRALTPKRTHLRWLRSHPPVWTAVASAVVLLGISDLAVGLTPGGYRGTFWDWLLYAVVAPVFAIPVYRLYDLPAAKTPVVEPVVETRLDELARDAPALERWLGAECPAEFDLLGHRRVAERIARRLVTGGVTGGGSVGLIGPFGSGKTSVVRWLEREAVRVRTGDQPEVWFSTQSCWGFEGAGAAVQQILSGAVREVGRRADCFTVRSLPEAYRRMFAAGGDWVRTLTDLVFGTTDPGEQFRHLNDILVAVNARLVLVVEDLDRNTGSRFDRQEVLALLHQLRDDYFHLSFVLAAGQATRDIDFAKLCDHIEVLPACDARQVGDLVGAVRSRCREMFSDIPTVPADDNPWEPTSGWLLARFGHLLLPDAAARLLRTPRAIKHALRRTYQGWAVLHGEIDFDHLLGVNVLRAGAPEAFDFLLRNWGQLRESPTATGREREQQDRFRNQLREDWQQSAAAVDWDIRAAQRIIEFLLPTAGAYLGDRGGIDRSRNQGVTHPRYWQRAVSEEVDAEHMRDQIVLRDIQEWAVSREACSALVVGLCTHPDYADVWEHYAPACFRQDREAFLCLADQVLGRFRTARGARVPGQPPHPLFPDAVLPHAAFAAVWRYANRTMPPGDESREWLEQQIRLAMPTSLPLVNDLYYYWASPQSGIVRSVDRRSLRQCILEAARDHIRSADDLIRISHPDQPYGVYRLVFPPDTDEGPSDCTGAEHWNWLAPVLLDALRREPGRFAVQVAHLISHDRRGEPGTGVMHQVRPDVLTDFFGEAAVEVVRCLADQRGRCDGRDRELLVQVVRSAEQHLNGDEPPPRSAAA